MVCVTSAEACSEGMLSKVRHLMIWTNSYCKFITCMKNPPKSFGSSKEYTESVKIYLNLMNGFKTFESKWYAMDFAKSGGNEACFKYGFFLNNLKQMSLDDTYKSCDWPKFSGYLRKWDDARYPLMACLFIEILSPAKVLSLVIQQDDTDIVSVAAAFEKTKKQSSRLIETNFEELTMVLRKVTLTEHGHEYVLIWQKLT